MRHMISVLGVAVLMVAMLLANALPALAIVEPAPQANCLASDAVAFNQREGFHGEGGKRTANEAQYVPVGLGDLATTDCV